MDSHPQRFLNNSIPPSLVTPTNSPQMIIPSWQQILNVFGVEMTEKVAHGCDVNVHISDLGFFGEGFITEGGTVVGKTALIEVEERRLKYTEGTLPHGYVGLIFLSALPVVLIPSQHERRLWT